MKYIVILFCYFLTLSISARKDKIYIANSSVMLGEKDAILILPGFGSKINGTKKITDFFFNKQIDVFIPDYISRKSIAECVKNLDGFITKHNLKKYRRIYVFSYIVGSWTLNNWIINNPENNISAIVYDRSPLQERAPYALVKDIPIIIKMISGKIMKEFSNTQYPSISNDKMKVGIIIECKATKLISKHKKSALSLGPISWNPEKLNQNYNDDFYTWLNHDDMYTRFDITGNEIVYFFANGKFTDNAKREPYLEDPFIKYLEKK
jgi:hypothetical protein